MVCKYLEKRIEVLQEEINSMTGNVLELEYYLVESDFKEEESSEMIKGYGIEIIKKENGVFQESIIVKNIYCLRDNSESLVRKLLENTVTPVSLPYILDDLIGV